MTNRVSLLLIAILLLLFSYLFLKGQSFDINQPIDANRFDQFGGFIGGILSSVSIFILVLTYRFSLKSNEIEDIERYINAINAEINEASFDGKRGTEAYLAFDLKTSKENIVLDHLNLVITTFNSTFHYVESSKTISLKQKNDFKKRLYLIFYSKVLWPLHKTIIRDGVDYINQHDDSKIILPKYADLGIQSIKYLMHENVAAESSFKEGVKSDLEKISAIWKI